MIVYVLSTAGAVSHIVYSPFRIWFALFAPSRRERGVRGGSLMSTNQPNSVNSTSNQSCCFSGGLDRGPVP
ncbi:hypothetical protein BDV12DRAFT_172628 [Aspergillus spectabilis]